MLGFRTLQVTLVCDNTVADANITISFGASDETVVSQVSILILISLLETELNT